MAYLDRVFENASQLTVIPNPVTFTGATVFSSTVDLTGATVTGLTATASAVSPDADDGAALGTTSLKWSDLFLASGGVINFAAGNVTITHSTGALTVAGGTVQLGESTTGVTTAGGTSMLYAYGYHKTNALTGTLRAVRGNAVCHVTSAAGAVYGGYFRGANGKATTDTDGVALNEATGTFSLVAGVGNVGGAVTLAKAYGVWAQLDIDAANLTISDARGIYAHVQSGNASANTLTACNLAYLEYESVVGTAPAINSMIKMACVGGNSGVTQLIDASTVTPVAVNTNENILMKFLDTTGTVRYLLFDPDSATSVKVGNSV